MASRKPGLGFQPWCQSGSDLGATNFQLVIVFARSTGKILVVRDGQRCLPFGLRFHQQLSTHDLIGRGRLPSRPLSNRKDSATWQSSPPVRSHTRRVASENSANFSNLCRLSLWNHQSLSRCQLFRIVDDIPIGIENLFPAR